MNHIVRFTAGTVLLLCCGLMTFCSGRDPAYQAESNPPIISDSIVAYNRQTVQAESQEIDDYIARHHWAMNQSSTGLRYMIYKQGKGRNPANGDFVTIQMTLSLLNGDVLSNSHDKTFPPFQLGKRAVVSGLEEGLMLMQQGSRAKLIVPSHMAYGLLGDLEKIPAGATLVYDVELFAISKAH